jgi:hypothetical protein
MLAPTSALSTMTTANCGKSSSIAGDVHAGHRARLHPMITGETRETLISTCHVIIARAE